MFFIIRILIATVIIFWSSYNQIGWTCLILVLIYAFLEVNSYITGMTRETMVQMEEAVHMLQIIQKNETALRAELYKSIAKDLDELRDSIDKLKSESERQRLLCLKCGDASSIKLNPRDGGKTI